MSQIFYPQKRSSELAESNALAEHTAETAGGSFEVFSSMHAPVSQPSGKLESSVREIPFEDLLKSILLVSSDDTLRSMLRSYLESLGYLVFSCTDTHRASQLFHSGTAIDLLLADLHLLGTPALDLASEIEDANHDLRIVLITGPSLENVVLSTIRQRGWSFQSKPVLLPRLFALIQEVLGKQQIRSKRRQSSSRSLRPARVVSFSRDTTLAETHIGEGS